MNCHIKLYYFDCANRNILLLILIWHNILSSYIFSCFIWLRVLYCIVLHVFMFMHLHVSCCTVLQHIDNMLSMTKQFN